MLSLLPNFLCSAFMNFSWVFRTLRCCRDCACHSVSMLYRLDIFTVSFSNYPHFSCTSIQLIELFTSLIPLLVSLNAGVIVQISS